MMIFTDKLLKLFGIATIVTLAVFAALAAMPSVDAHFSDQADEVHTADAPQAQESGDPEANLPFLFAVFAITWAAFFGHAFYMSRRQRDMRSEIRALRRMLEQRESTGGDEPGSS